MSGSTFYRPDNRGENPEYDTVVVNETIQSDSEQPQDVTSSRSSNTWETNSTAFPLLITVVALNSGAGNRADLNLQINTSQTTETIARQTVAAHDANNVRGIVVGLVPPGHDYRVFIGGGSLDTWREQKVGDDGN